MKNQYKYRNFICIGCNVTIYGRVKNNRKYCSLECYRKSKRPNKKTGKFIKCKECKKEIYKTNSYIKNNNNICCSRKCYRIFIKKTKIKYICKMCNKNFYWSKSREKNTGYVPKYCSIICRNNDPEKKKQLIKMNILQQNKKGLNKLELEGRKILKYLGLKKNVNFKEQVLMYNKFLVDVLIETKKLIIQWDGEYWHKKEKRKMLDKSQDKYLNKCGYKVLRITDKQIKNNIKEVYENIRTTIQ